VLKSQLLRLLLVPGVTAPLERLTRGRAAIMMLHRFRVPELGIAGHDPAAVRIALAYLRRQRYELLPLGEVFERLANGRGLRRAVAFTMDDGYFDQASVAGPVFAEFDCPVTTFVTTGFLDGNLWMWWDRIEYAFERCKRTSIQLRIEERTVDLTWDGPEERDKVRARFTESCKQLPDARKRELISQLGVACDVEIPAQPPAAYAPMSWEELRACEERGMTFGPHTVTHPILARTDDDQSRRELSGSWDRLRQCARRPVPIYCYPNGGPADFGPREVETLRGLGFAGAVIGEAGYAEFAPGEASGSSRFRVRRFSFPDALPELVQYVCGLEMLKSRLRGGLPG
jgi:peptidoglycan/xylan/chitin deacetylase (PgdA/CDA1 family)